MIFNCNIYDERTRLINPLDPHKKDLEGILVLFLVALLKPEKAFVIRKWWLSFEQTKRIVVNFGSKSPRQKRNIGFCLGKNQQDSRVFILETFVPIIKGLMYGLLYISLFD